jgi:hypothetical protein
LEQTNIENTGNTTLPLLGIFKSDLAVNFREVVHPVLTEEAEVAEASDSIGEPDERA